MRESGRPGRLDRLHHAAVVVRDVPEAVDWYTSRFRCEVQYRDDTWAMLQFENVQIALVVRDEHPAHLGFTHPAPEDYGTLKKHRDGTRSIYVQDPSGNAVEFLAERNDTTNSD